MHLHFEIGSKIQMAVSRIRRSICSIDTHRKIQVHKEHFLKLRNKAQYKIRKRLSQGKLYR